ncbi:MAG: hypothetical protein OXG55_14790, partial [bacterium]|nr:hypothetical protein [bacterium]
KILIQAGDSFIDKAVLSGAVVAAAAAARRDRPPTAISAAGGDLRAVPGRAGDSSGSETGQDRPGHRGAGR